MGTVEHGSPAGVLGSVQRAIVLPSRPLRSVEPVLQEVKDQEPMKELASTEPDATKL